MPSFLLTGLKKIISIGKKVFLVIAVYFIVVSLFFHFLGRDKAANKISFDPIKKNREEIYKIINDKELNKTKEGKLAIVFYKGTMCSLIGEACTINPADGDKNFDNSLFGKVTSLIVLPLANPPASSLAWAYSGLQNASLIPKSYAAEGIGFAAIKPFANLWKIFRDVSYMLLVIILIAIGFMIMFRMKMNPQTVINVENALPRIVVAMILITFSFAIAGFLIDLMYVSIILIVSILSNGNTYYNASQFQNEFIGANGLDMFTHAVARSSIGDIIPVIGDSLIGLLPQTITLALHGIVGFISAFVFNGLFSGVISSIGHGLDNIQLQGVGTGGSIGSSPALVGVPIATAAFWSIFFIWGIIGLYPLIIYFLVGGTIVFLVFRIFALVFSSYIKLLLLTIISPFLLIFEAIPGRSAFSSWIKNIIGNLLVFPITIAVFLIGYIIVNSSMPTGYNDVRLPYLYGPHSNSFKIIIGMGLILLIPDLVKIAKEALGIKDIPLSIGVGTFFGGAGAVVGGATGIAGQFSTMSLGLSAVTGKGLHDLFSGKPSPNPSVSSEVHQGVTSAVTPIQSPSGTEGRSGVQRK